MGKLRTFLLIKLINKNIDYIHTAVFVEVCPHLTFSTNHNLSTLILFENQNGIKDSDNVIFKRKIQHGYQILSKF